MTANQINYAKLLEDTRSHLVNEEVAKRNATSNERQAAVAEKDSVTKEKSAQASLLSANASMVSAQAAASNAATRQEELLLDQEYRPKELAQKQAELEQKKEVAAETERHNKAAETDTDDDRLQKYITGAGEFVGAIGKILTTAALAGGL